MYIFVSAHVSGFSCIDIMHARILTCGVHVLLHTDSERDTDADTETDKDIDTYTDTPALEALVLDDS